MWADSLLLLERAHLERLAVWGGGSVLLGTLVLAVLIVRRSGSPLLRHFAIQTALWGAIDLAIVVWAWRGLGLRDLDGATWLTNFLWLNVGLDLGYVALGVTLAVCSWSMGRRLGGVGAGTGIVVQGLALALLDLMLLSQMAATRVS